MHPGDIIADRYRLDEVVGEGGMGQVWRATDLELRRQVALKLTRTGDGEQTRREARIGAGVQHPNVIAVFDVVVEDGRRWLVLEYLPSRSLDEVCRADGPLGPEQVARIGVQVLAALGALHEKGMVHRDVKPANILLAPDGTAKLSDLGVATWDQVTLTGSAFSVGTPGYLAPEVVAGVRVTGAADLYALGVTLAAVAEGRADRRLTEVLAAFTADNPARRPSTAEAIRMLRGLLPRTPHKRGVVTALGGVAALLAAAVLLWPETPSAEQPSAQPGGRAELLFGLGDQLNSALAAELVHEAPVRMLTTNYHKPSDLTKLASWRDTLVADAYAQGYALHVVVADWETDDPEVPVDTAYGVGCGRAHPLSVDFPRHMRTLARAFAGKADGPPLYVTVFQEVNKFACVDGAYAADPATTAYYRALQDRYREVREIIREEAPNARVALGWDAWQARDDDPGTGAGRSMFAHFAETLRTSDFQAVLAKQPDGNVEDVRGCVRALSAYGPVMVAAYGNKRTAEVIGRDLRALFAEHTLAELTRHRLFAWNFNTVSVLTGADRPTRDFVEDVVRRVGRNPR